jgi:hypothetical protein
MATNSEQKDYLLASAVQQSKLLHSLNHPNIIKATEIVVGTSPDEIYLVMEEGGDDLGIVMSQGGVPPMPQVNREGKPEIVGRTSRSACRFQ